MKQRAKAANGAGAVERRGNRWWARISLPDGRRKRVPLPNSEKMSEAMAREKAAFYGEQVRLGKIVFDATPRRRKGAAVPSPTAPALTVRQLGTAWTSGELLKRFGGVNRLRVKATAKIDAWTLKKHAYEVKTRGPSAPAFGDLPVADVTTDDISVIMGTHSQSLRAQTRTHTYQRLRRLFDLAIFPLKLRPEGSNPVTRYVRPERDADMLFCFLYPTEVLALLRGTNAKGDIVVPLARRVLYALGTYTGQRKASLLAMRWKHVDFTHGTLASFKTKTGRAQYFVGDPGLMAVLEAWHARCGKPPGDSPIVIGPKRPKKGDARDIRDVEHEVRRLATALRADLKAVGVTRELLFEEEAPNVELLRFHDLRSTFCTWARREGKSDVWISERTGHDVSGGMISRYDRGAQTLADLGYQPFADITGAFPDLPALAKPLAKDDEKGPGNPDVESPKTAGNSDISEVVGARGFEPPTPRSRTETSDTEEQEGAAKLPTEATVSVPFDAPKSATGQPRDNEGGNPIDPLEAALAAALDGATRAGEWGVVAQLARELEARRQGRAANVVPLRPERSRRTP